MEKIEIRGNIMLDNLSHADKVSSKLNKVVHYAELFKLNKPVSPDMQVDAFFSVFRLICWLYLIISIIYIFDGVIEPNKRSEYECCFENNSYFFLDL